MDQNYVTEEAMLMSIIMQMLMYRRLSYV